MIIRLRSARPTRPGRNPFWRVISETVFLFLKPGWTSWFITVMDYVVKKKHFCSIITSKKSIASEISPCEKTSIWLLKQGLICKLIPLRSVLLAIISQKVQICYSYKIRTLINRVRPNLSKSLHWGPCY